jgi:hypothetical protein
VDIVKTRSVLIAAVVALGGARLAEGPPVTPHFRTCTAMHRTYPYGVGRADATATGVKTYHLSDSLYAANKALDGDGDGVACEVKR